MTHSMKNILIGSVVVIGLLLIVQMVLFVQPKIGDEKQKLVVRFTNVNGIHNGTRVLFSGRPIGKVVRVSFIPNARFSDEDRPLYFYELTLHIDSSVHIYRTDKIVAQTAGLLGEKWIAIVPRPVGKGTTPPLASEGKVPLYAQPSSDDVTDLIQDLKSLSAKLNQWAEVSGGDVMKTIHSLRHLLQQAGLLFSSCQQEEVLPKISRSIQAFSFAMGEMGTLCREIKKEEVVRRAKQALSSAQEAAQSAHVALTKLNEGQGSLGKLLSDNYIHLRLTTILSKIDTMMNDLNHYGLLFHLNKSWQRTRVKQATQFNALKSPQHLRQYFLKEADLIHTALARLFQTLESIKADPNPKEAIHPIFRQSLEDLYYRVEELSRQIYLYQQQCLIVPSPIAEPPPCPPIDEVP